MLDGRNECDHEFNANILLSVLPIIFNYHWSVLFVAPVGGCDEAALVFDQFLIRF